MGKLLKKEMRLSASILSYLFILFGFMTLIPGYPILMSAFFVSFGIFQSFQAGRENNDIVYSSLLPIAKADIVKGKYIFSAFIEMCGFAVMTVLCIIRMTWLSDAPVYTSNFMMSANLVYLGFTLLVFTAFNCIFIGGFFKTAYNFGKPFIFFLIASFLIITVGEALHHFPGLESFDSTVYEAPALQLGFLAVCVIVYIAFTSLSLKRSIASFEKIDL